MEQTYPWVDGVEFVLYTTFQFFFEENGGMVDKQLMYVPFTSHHQWQDVAEYILK